MMGIDQLGKSCCNRGFVRFDAGMTPCRQLHRRGFIAQAKTNVCANKHKIDTIETLRGLNCAAS